MVEIRDHQTSTGEAISASAKRFQSAGHPAGVPSVAMSVYIATMTHTAVTFQHISGLGLAGSIAGLGLGRDAMMPGVRPNATSRPGRPHSQRGMSEDSPSRVKGLQVSRQEKSGICI